MSDAWSIEPNGPLHGEIAVHGSKNAVTKHMVAALLGGQPSTITNVPEVGDVDITAGILTAVGALKEIRGQPALRGRWKAWTGIGLAVAAPVLWVSVFLAVAENGTFGIF